MQTFFQFRQTKKAIKQNEQTFYEITNTQFGKNDTHNVQKKIIKKSYISICQFKKQRILSSLDGYSDLAEVKSLHIIVKLPPSGHFRTFNRQKMFQFDVNSHDIVKQPTGVCYSLLKYFRLALNTMPLKQWQTFNSEFGGRRRCAYTHCGT